MTNDSNDEMPAAEEGGERAPSLVVGLGASAGGIEALRAFFSQVPNGTGIAYVVILHLSPEYESHLAQVLQTASLLPVTTVAESTPLARDRVYVVSPNQKLTIENGRLVVGPVTSTEERRAPVDMFFRSLADGYDSAAVAVVLSGTGPNGSNGIKRVKERGGLTLVQDPAEAEFADMPRNSLATGLIDHVLPVEQLPGRIVEYARRRATAKTPPLDAGDARAADEPESMERVRAEQDWRNLLKVLRQRTGHDFTNYKHGTVRRRVERRLNVRNVSTLANYVALLRADPNEPVLLMKELLISVTNFFRDASAFEALASRVLPTLFERKDGNDQIRVWSVGCATGEEAYSLAMLLAERASQVADAPAIQIFGTDLDQQAITVAREGLYSEADVADVSPERLRRFFQRDSGGYRVRRELRELVLFAPHNVIKDPPFSHLDLVTCRNLLIYLNRHIQERLLETFHFALRPGGFLFLGGAETGDGSTHLFATMDKDAHIFESRTAASRLGPLALERPLPATPPLPRLPEPHPQPERVPPGELHLRLLEEFAPPSVVVDEQHVVLHMSSRAGTFLRMAGGELSRDLLQLVHADLRGELRTALHLAARDRASIEIGGVQADLGAGPRRIRMTVRPVLREGTPARGYFLVLFEDEGFAPSASAPPPPVQLASAGEPEVQRLGEELTYIKSQLRTTIEQYETHAEEARAVNEELQAMNEELRSAAEELETSKEELQSVNEELTTVNQELKLKVDELRLANSDFQNLINSTEIAAIFLDRARRVKLSTPRAQDIFNLQAGDVGRSLSDFTSRLLHDGLDDDVTHVLQRLQTVEREVATRDGRWFLMRILPYRTSDDRIDGVALTFVDITGRRRAEDQVGAGEERQQLLIDSVVDYAIFTMTADGKVDSWNAGAQRMFGFTAQEILGRDGAVLFTPEDRAAGIPAQEIATARARGRASDERWHVRKDGSRFYCSGVTTHVAAGNTFVKIARDLTERRQAEAVLEEARQALETRVQQRTRELQEEVERGAAARAHITTLLRRIVTAQEEERTRIARDLHDLLGQQLTALRLALQRHREQHAAGDGAAELDAALELAHAIDREVDFLAWELRPAALDDLGLVAALPRYLREWSAHYLIPAEFHAPPDIGGALPKTAEVAFYRVAQEALNNVVKHAHATRVDVLLEKRDSAIVLVVEDDGVGFDVASGEATAKGLGLAGMRERASLVGATLDIESTAGGGTAVFLRCPVAQAT